MSTYSRVEISTSPIENTLDDLVAAPLTVLFALGIVNPFGPTLSFVATVGNLENGSELPIVQVMLNPFSQTVHQVGRLFCGDVWNPVSDLAPLFKLEFGSCPTLLLLNVFIGEDNRKEVARQLLQSFEADVLRRYSGVHSFRNDPWSRVSAEMGGFVIKESCSPSEAAERLAEIVITPDHCSQELKALFYAWNGSIENTAISDDLKMQAMSFAHFDQFFWERLAPSLWIPEPLTDKPKTEYVESKPLELKSFDDIRGLLFNERAWQTLSPDNILILLREAMTMYGADVAEAYIPMLGRLYSYAVSLTDVEHRGLMTQQLNERVEDYRLSTMAFCPILIREPDLGIASTATINFLSCSTYDKTGELGALGILRIFFEAGELENPGAVFGALICMGERSLWPFIDEVRGRLSIRELDVAAQVFTPFMQHWAVQYWLRWAQELVACHDDISQKQFGNVCSALAIPRTKAQGNRIDETVRTFPCFSSEQPLKYVKTWSLDDYAREIVDDLYELERVEMAPKLMSAVLRAWGLQPRAPLEEQYIPDP